MKWLKRITVVINMLCIVSCIMSVSAFAVDPEVIEVGETAGALIFDLYGAANNTSLAYDSIQPGPALTEIITLYQTAQAEAGGDPISMTALGTALLAAGAIGVVYDAGEAVYQLAVALDYENFGEFWYDFNHSWDVILSDTAGLVRDATSGLFNWTEVNNQVSPIPVYLDIPFPNQPIPIYDGAASQTKFEAGYLISNVKYSNTYSRQRSYVSNSSPNLYIFHYGTDQTYAYYAVAAAEQYNTLYGSGVEWVQDTGVSRFDNLGNIGTSQVYDSNVRYGTFKFTISSAQFTNYAPVFSSLEAGLAYFSSYISDPNNSGIYIEPSVYVGDPLQNPLEITIPDPSTPMTDPIRIGTNIEVDPQLLPDSVPADPVPGTYYPITDPAALNDIVPEAWEDLVADGVEVNTDPTPDDPGPGPDGSITEVFTPLLPTTLPSFDFNFSSIWHYVREWVGSLRSFFTVLFSVWAALPYAIVVPVYATAVIVIVLGVYKRFFG